MIDDTSHTHLHCLCTDRYCAPLAPLVYGMQGNAGHRHHSAIGRTRANSRLIASNGPRRLATRARSIASRSVRTQSPANAPAGTPRPARAACAGIFVSIFQTLFSIARRTRAVIQHIPGFQNLGFLVRRDPCEL
jgi:hypothetical protein